MAWGCNGTEHENTITSDVSHPCLVEIHVLEERPISISKAENSIFIISFHKYMCDRYEKIHTIKIINRKFKQLFQTAALLLKIWRSRFLQNIDTQTPHQTTLILIIIAFSTSNLIFMALFNPKQKLNIMNPPNSFKTLPSSCVNDTDK
jgi:hypothetical protein